MVLYELESGHRSRCVDIVRDVINLTPVYWVSKFVSGLPIKCKEDPNAPHTEEEAYEIYMVIFTFIFLNIQPEYGWFLRENAKTAGDCLLYHINRHLTALTSILNPMRVYDDLKHALWGEDANCHAFMKRLIQGGAGRPLDQLAYNILGVSVASAANYAHATAQVVNLYLDDKYAKERAEIIEIANLPVYGPEEEARLEGYVREAMRLDPQAPGVFRDVAADGVIREGDVGHGEKEIRVKAGDKLFVSLANANEDPNYFKDPEKIDPERKESAYMLFGGGDNVMHNCLGNQFVIKTMPYVLRSIFRLKNLRRGPGKSGQLNRFTQDLYGTKQHMYLSETGMPTPWPGSMVLQYDE